MKQGEYGSARERARLLQRSLRLLKAACRYAERAHEPGTVHRIRRAIKTANNAHRAASVRFSNLSPFSHARRRPL